MSTTPRWPPPAHYVHGLTGPIVVVPEKAAAWLARFAGLAPLLAGEAVCGGDPEVNTVLRDLCALGDSYLRGGRDETLTWEGSAGGTGPAGDDPESWVTVADAAAELGITTRGVRRAVTDGRLPAVRRGGRWFLTPGAVAQFAARAA